MYAKRLNLIKKIFFLYLVSFVVAAYGSENYERAIDMNSQSVMRAARLTRFAQETSLSTEGDGLIEVKSIRLQNCNVAYLAKENKKVYIIPVKQAISKLKLHWNNSVRAEFTGEVALEPATIATSLTQPILSILDDLFDQKNDQIIVCGNEDAGAVSYLLGFNIHKSFQSRGKKFNQNQLKVITFCSSAAGDSKFVSALHTNIGQANILSFYYYLSPLQNLYNKAKGYRMCGVPLRILPSEQFSDAYKEGDRKVTVLNVVACCIFVRLAHLYLYPQISCHQSLESISSIYGSVMSILTKSLESVPYDVEKAIHDVLEGTKNRLIMESNKYILRDLFLTSLLCCVNNFWISSRISRLPTDLSIKNSFEYAQDSINSSDGFYPLDRAGLVPLFSSSRGVGGYLHRLFLGN